MLIKPLVKVVLTSGWYWVPAFFWIIASIIGAGLSFKGVGLAAVMSAAWFFAIYAVFGTALSNAIDDDQRNKNESE